MPSPIFLESHLERVRGGGYTRQHFFSYLFEIRTQECKTILEDDFILLPNDTGVFSLSLNVGRREAFIKI